MASRKNIESLVNFYKSGIKADSQKIGVELEYTLIRKDKSQVKYFDEYGQLWLMKQLKQDFNDDILDEKNNLIGINNDFASVTLEPAGQFELSAGPFEELSQIDETFSNFEQKINSLVNPHDIEMIAIGYHPYLKAEELEIIPKVRYRLMNQYFLQNSPLGIRMMRGTGSTQISIDYNSEADAIRKLRLAYAITPLLSLLTDNTPIFEGKKSTHHLMRTEVWEDCDKRRTGILPGLFDNDFCFEKCAKYVLDTQAMFEMDGDEGHLTNKTIDQIYAKNDMKKIDCMNAVSHLFNDVRLKNFIEIRPADALSHSYATAYAALIKGIFYNENSLLQLLETYRSVNEKSYVQAKENCMTDGFDAIIYDNQKVYDLVLDLLKKASLGLDEDERNYLNPFQTIIDNKKTLAQTSKYYI